MDPKKEYVKLRNIDVFPAELEGQKVFCLRDPMNLAGKILFLPYPAFFIVRLFDGQHSILDIQAEFMRHFGRLLYREDVERLAQQLDEHYFLESERFHERQKKLKEDFSKTAVRPMALAGESYEKDPKQLEDVIAAFYESPHGPGRSAFPFDEGKRLIGAVAPHIDYRRGGYCYAHAHRAILERSKASVFIILGTSHMAMKKPYALTSKNFETPWGPVETDRAFLELLQAHLSTDFYEDEWVHKGEHSIELQLVFQKGTWKDRPPFKIVPILCGSFHEAIGKGQSPLEVPGIQEFIEALKKAIAQFRDRICLVASADLAHLGLRFGDPDPPTPSSLRKLEEEDRKLLERVEQIDAEGFYEILLREKDQRKVCGLSSIYTLLKVIEAQEGKLLKYEQSVDSQTQSVVTFASLAFLASV